MHGSIVVKNQGRSCKREKNHPVESAHFAPLANPLFHSQRIRAGTDGKMDELKVNHGRRLPTRPVRTEDYGLRQPTPSTACGIHRFELPSHGSSAYHNKMI
jgi:hypothetical protein